MTKAFDEQARKSLLSSYHKEDFDYNGIPIRDMEVREISVKEARPYIAMFHYSKTMPDSTKYVYAGYLDGRLCGIVVYGMGTGKSQYQSVIPSIQNGEYVELTRLWCPNSMPRNTESKLISMSLKMLPKTIKLVVSYADEGKNHVGIIYQATNWYYLGKNDGGKMLLCADGRIQHPRLIGIYRLRHPELRKLTNQEIMDKYGWKYVEGGKKNKYVFIRGTKKEKKSMFQEFKDLIQPYPKLVGKNVRRLSEDEMIWEEINRIDEYQVNLFTLDLVNEREIVL